MDSQHVVFPHTHTQVEEKFRNKNELLMYWLIECCPFGQLSSLLHDFLGCKNNLCAWMLLLFLRWFPFSVQRAKTGLDAGDTGRLLSCLMFVAEEGGTSISIRAAALGNTECVAALRSTNACVNDHPKSRRWRSPIASVQSGL